MAFAAATQDIGRYEEALVFKQTIEAPGDWKSRLQLRPPAIGNRGYTNDVRLRGRKKRNSTRAGGFCVCRRGFNRRVYSTREGGFCVCRRGFNRRVSPTHELESPIIT